MEKMEAHRQGLLHRAFSVFIFNSRGEMLLQQRAHDKYHSPGLWTNTCCSHPMPGESTSDAATRRLSEEMGLSCPLRHLFQFIYRIDFSNGLTEHELDHVYIGITDQEPHINPEEVSDYRYIALHDLETDLRENPANYTEWFRLCVARVIESQSSHIPQ